MGTYSTRYLISWSFTGTWTFDWLIFYRDLDIWLVDLLRESGHLIGWSFMGIWTFDWLIFHGNLDIWLVYLLRESGHLMVDLLQDLDRRDHILPVTWLVDLLQGPGLAGSYSASYFYRDLDWRDHILPVIWLVRVFFTGTWIGWNVFCQLFDWLIFFTGTWIGGNVFCQLFDWLNFFLQGHG
jgi:hypothetical protein